MSEVTRKQKKRKSGTVGVGVEGVENEEEKEAKKGGKEIKGKKVWKQKVMKENREHWGQGEQSGKKRTRDHDSQRSS